MHSGTFGSGGGGGGRVEVSFVFQHKLESNLGPSVCKYGAEGEGGGRYLLFSQLVKFHFYF